MRWVEYCLLAHTSRQGAFFASYNPLFSFRWDYDESQVNEYRTGADQCYDLQIIPDEVNHFVELRSGG